MKKKLVSFLAKLSARSFVASILIAAMLTTMTSVVIAAVTEESDGVWVTDRTETAPFSDEGAEWFYRTSVDDDGDEWLYGYGYSDEGYGYGFGYGYDYIDADGYDWAWPTNYLEMGVFMAANYGEFAVDPDAELPIAFEMTGSGDFAGVSVALPAGLEFTYSGAGEWSGTIAVSGSDEVGDLTGFVADDVLFVVVELLDPLGEPLDGDVLLSMPAVVTVPYAGFDDGLVAASFGGEQYTIAECTAEQFDDEMDMDDPLAYTLAAAVEEDDIEHCYNVDADNVYIATNHFSEFGAGAGEDVDDDDDDGGGSSGGSAKKKTTAESSENLTVADFVDLVNLTSANWEYQYVVDALNLGLFHGEKNANGEPVFNMYNHMNRAEAAQVIANYLGCEAATLTVAPFTDVPLDAWYAQPIACLKEKGVVNGKTPLLYDPAGKVTRLEFFKMSVEAYLSLHPNMKTEWQMAMDAPSTYFADVNQTDWFAKYSNLAANKGLLTGYAENGKYYFKPNVPVFRVEAAAMLVRLINYAI